MVIDSSAILAVYFNEPAAPCDPERGLTAQQYSGSILKGN